VNGVGRAEDSHTTEKGSDEMADVIITPLDNGPYLVKGPAKIIDVDGTTYDVKKETVALCRCGGSTSKPFCDGTHSKTGFAAANRAVQGK
jgi:CDGSH-type Zn-finger protein